MVLNWDSLYGLSLLVRGRLWDRVMSAQSPGLVAQNSDVGDGLASTAEHHRDIGQHTATVMDRDEPPEDAARWPRREKSPRHHRRRTTDQTTTKYASPTECFLLENMEP